MAFEVGNTLGALTAGKAKPRHIYDAMMREVIQNPAKLKEACASVLDAAASGDLNALDWIATRLEGRPAQVSPDSGDVIPDVTLIKMIVMQPNSNQFNELATIEAVKEIPSQETVDSLPTPSPLVGQLSEVG